MKSPLVRIAEGTVLVQGAGAVAGAGASARAGAGASDDVVDWRWLQGVVYGNEEFLK